MGSTSPCVPVRRTTQCAIATCRPPSNHAPGGRCQSPERDAHCIAAALPPTMRVRRSSRRSMTVKFRVELVWQDEDDAASSIFLTADGRVILQGRAISPQERQALALPAEGDMISVDRDLIRAIKDML